MSSARQKIEQYFKPLQSAFIDLANSNDAISMASYMKNHFLFFGIRSSQRKEIGKLFLKEYGKPNLEDLPEIVHYCFRKKEREYQYFCVDLVCSMVKKLPPTFFTTSEWMIQNKSWWDTVDSIASNIIGTLVQMYPEFKSRVGNYIDHEDMWMQRTALIYQLKYRSGTDRDRLFDFCEGLSGDNRFFIKKAIGWALREYSKTDEKSVEIFIKSSKISNFSKKEALKWINRV